MWHVGGKENINETPPCRFIHDYFLWQRNEIESAFKNRGCKNHKKSFKVMMIGMALIKHIQKRRQPLPIAGRGCRNASMMCTDEDVCAFIYACLSRWVSGP